MRRRDRISIHANVDVEDVLEELDDETLLAEINARDLAKLRAKQEAPEELLHEAYEQLQSGDIHEATLSLERALFPKWKTPDACREAYQQLRNSARPS